MTSQFDVVARVGPAVVFADGPPPRAPSDRHGAVVDEGERVAVFARCGPSWPTPEVGARGEALVRLRDPTVARTFFYGRVDNSFHHVFERVGGVAVPALARRVRRRAGTLPVPMCARIARDLARAQARLDVDAPGLVATVSDALVAWDGRVIVTPRLFGAAGDVPLWARPAWRITPVNAIGAVLFALLVPSSQLGADVDASLAALLADERTRLEGSEAPADLEELVMRALARTGGARGREGARQTAALAAQLDVIVTRLGGDDDAFAASLMAELFERRRARDLEWREELSAAPLPI